MDGGPDQPRELDAWSVALFAYFVGLIVLVAVLLVLPALY
jgi:hypothetical protein